MLKTKSSVEKLYVFLSNLEAGHLVKEHLETHNEIIPLYKKFVAFIEGDVNFIGDDVSRFILSYYFTKLTSNTQVRYKKYLILLCQNLGRKIPSRLEGLSVFNIVDFDQFVKNYCSIGKGSIWAEKLLRAYNRYRLGKRYCFSITSTAGMTQYLKKKGIKATSKGARGKITYLGIGMNDSGLALIENNFRDNAMLKAKKNKNLFPNKACKLISCNPDVLLLKKIVNEYNQKRESQTEKINLLKAKKILKNIERFCFQQNWNPHCKTKIGLALYLTTTFSFNRINKNFGIPYDSPMRLKVRIGRTHPKALERLVRYSKVFSRNPNCLEKEKEKILSRFCEIGHSIPEITKILRARGYKVNAQNISKCLSLWISV